jgi:hypothetical protein
VLLATKRTFAGSKNSVTIDKHVGAEAPDRRIAASVNVKKEPGHGWRPG